MLPLKCSAQNYEWGRLAHESEVAHLAGANGTTVDKSKPYAELWMGTHPNCPSTVVSTGQSLSAWIHQHSHVLGPSVQNRWGDALPFLFKVLSVRKALSIQSHPDKKLAEQLRQDHPQWYADDNHKPEMALAISDDFAALCCFRPLPELLAMLADTPELAQLVGPALVASLGDTTTPDAGKQALRSAFTALMTSLQPAISSAVAQLVARLAAQQALAGSTSLSPHEALALQLDVQYPGGDVGVLSAFFLNLVRLRAGQALYLAANEPHAYLEGELVECMATSDNVIRAGLTPKFKHADVLCASLTYELGLPEILHGTPLDVVGGGEADVTQGSLCIYRPPFEEFEVRCARVPAGGTLVLCADQGPQLALVQAGAGIAMTDLLTEAALKTGLQERVFLEKGVVFFVAAGTRLELQAAEPLLIWVAAVNDVFFQLSKLQDVSRQHTDVLVGAGI